MTFPDFALAAQVTQRVVADLSGRDLGSTISFQADGVTTVCGLLDKVQHQRGWDGEGLGKSFLAVQGQGGHRWSGHLVADALVSLTAPVEL